MRIIRISPTPAMIGPRLMGMRGPMRVASRPARAEPNSMMSVIGQERRARRDRREADDGLELDRQQEERAGERGVDHERHQVRRGELLRLEDRERHQRVRAALLDPDERAEADQPADQRDQHDGRGPALLRAGGEPGDQPGEAERPRAPRRRSRARCGACSLRVSGTWRRPTHSDDRGERQVDQEDPAPRRGLRRASRRGTARPRS